MQTGNSVSQLAGPFRRLGEYCSLFHPSSPISTPLAYNAGQPISCLVHLVFATAERRPASGNDIRARLHSYLGGIARENAMVALAIGGTADRVHILLSLSRTTSVSKAVQLLKSGSSKWLNDHNPRLRFAWQEGFGAFSIGISQQGDTIAYIQNQDDHHERMSFADEWKKFLRAHGIQPGV